MVSAGDDALPVMRVAVLTTSYPRRPGDPAGHFVGAAVEWLRARGCHEAQGFLFSRALPAADAHKLLRRAAETAAGTRTQRLRSLIG